MSTNRFIQSFTKVPKELFRLNTSPAIRLRAQPGPVRPQRSFDLLTEAGKVQPKALNPATYEWPNGASMRPNSEVQQKLVRTFSGNVYVYTVPEGTELPNDLILVHEFADHYSLQAKEEMTVEELNAKITNFLTTKGECLTRDQWLQKYPQATE
ncbi:hypothetical protein TESG_03051 [Trichophyton tonsurans CBS 112818]|uniref:Tse2 ADP-ribosyltransferase toxin domain-containing protein n=1 Tax=Trichophyton tonsurans (strain CBS 112818) TaxID=647933 RepID=F2RWA2_TRIT1|nr:hypothetical protein TESG_03051 [Trichophyton tonsurans CBS 112818]